MNDEIIGDIRFSEHWTIDASQMGQWSPERITQFFEGLAEVIRAWRGSPLPSKAPLLLTYLPDSERS